jgi:hypothetical protein
VLRVPSSFHLTLARSITTTCAQAVTRLLKDTRRWEVRSARAGSKGQRALDSPDLLPALRTFLKQAVAQQPPAAAASTAADGSQP